MSWEPEVITAADGAWPDAMVAVRNRTGERRRYVPENEVFNAQTTIQAYACRVENLELRLAEMTRYVSWYENEFEPKAREMVREFEARIAELEGADE